MPKIMPKKYDCTKTLDYVHVWDRMCGSYAKCDGCPLAAKHQLAEFKRYPKYKQAYIRAFDKMVKRRIELGKPTSWEAGVDVLKWWVGKDADQITNDN